MNDEYLKAIGRITLNFQNLESTCKSSYNILTGCDYYDSGMSTTVAFSKYLERIKKISKHLFPENSELREELRSVLINASKANRLRNDIIHSFWNEDEDPIKSWTKTTIGRYKLGDKDPDKAMKSEQKVFSYHEINKVADEIESVRLEWSDLIQKVFQLSSETQ